jgi:hypothetical protein
MNGLAISVRVSISLIGLGLGERDGAAEPDGKKEELNKTLRPYY